MINGFLDEQTQGGRIGVRDVNNPEKYKVDEFVQWEVTMPDTIASTPYF